jgi:hypothetical protein
MKWGVLHESTTSRTEGFGFIFDSSYWQNNPKRRENYVESMLKSPIKSVENSPVGSFIVPLGGQ